MSERATGAEIMATMKTRGCADCGYIPQPEDRCWYRHVCQNGQVILQFECPQCGSVEAWVEEGYAN